MSLPPTGNEPTARIAGADAAESLAAEYVAEAAAGTRPVLDEWVQRLSSDPERARFRRLIEDVETVDGLLPRQIREGVTLADRYRIVRELGHGGMGKVFEARDERLGRNVAVKVLATIDMPGVDLEALFQREVTVLASLSHPNIVAIHESGKDGDVSFLVMDRVHGTSLATVIEKLREKSGDGLPQDGALLFATLEQPAPPGSRAFGDPHSWPKMAAAIVADLARTIEAAHAAGVIHRDLKPSNVLLRGDGTPVVLDFGLAGLRERDTGLLTGALFGTSWYLAPEQVVTKRAGKDPRTDVYQLGLILYELLTLERAFAADELHDLLAKIVAGDFPRPRALRPELPADVEDVCLKAMELDPSARYQSAAELREDLDRFVTGSAPPRACSGSAWARAARNARYFARRHTAGLAAAALLFVGAGVGGACAWRAASSSAPPAAPAPVRAWAQSAGDSSARFIANDDAVHPGDRIGVALAGCAKGVLYAVNLVDAPGATDTRVVPLGSFDVASGDDRFEML